MSPPLLPPLDLELEGGILPDDGVRLVGAEQHVGGLAREEANTWLLETLIMLQGFERHLGDALPLQPAAAARPAAHHSRTLRANN